MIQVSAGIILRGNQILAAKRGEGRKNAHLWEFPGGKRQSGEDAATCLIRELGQELSLQVADVVPVFENEAQGIHFTFLTAKALNDPIATEHEELRWVDPRDLLTLSWCPADVDAARRLWLGSFTHFLWDFDGTLMDTYGMITDCVQKACRDYGIEETDDEILSLLKIELPWCLRVMQKRHGVSKTDLRSAYDRHADGADLSLVRPITSIPQLLRMLKEKGCRHYIVTHRSRATCEAMLAYHGLQELFDDMVTAEDPLPRKPAPDRCVAILQRHGIDPMHAVMVGDRPLDIEAGRAAGISTILLDAEGRFPDCRADLVVESAVELMTAYT